MLASSGPPGNLLEASWAVLEASWGLLGPSCAVVEASWADSEASWTLLGRLGGHLGPSWAVLEAILDHLGRTWRPSWAILAVLEAILGPSWRRRPMECTFSAGFRVAGGMRRSPRGSSCGKEPKPSRRVQHARHPYDKSIGGGGSKTPTANHRRALPFGNTYVAERCGQRPAKLSGHVFPESVWKAFGEHGGR